MVGLGCASIALSLILVGVGSFAAAPTAPTAPSLNTSLNPAGQGVYGGAPGGGAPTTKTIGDVVAQVVLIFFSLLGIIFVCFIVYGGFKWMTAAGNPDQVKGAQSLMRDAIIGVLILMAASFISYWVLQTISSKFG